MSNCQLQFPIAQLQLSNPIASDTKTICALYQLIRVAYIAMHRQIPGVISRCHRPYIRRERTFNHWKVTHHKKQQKTHSVSFLEEELGKVGTVLAGDTGDEGDLAVLVGRDFSRHVDVGWVFMRWVEMTSIELVALTMEALREK